MNDQEIEIINKETQKEKIVNFFKKNLKKIITLISILLLLILSFFLYQIYIKENKQQLAEKYNSAVINFESKNNEKIASIMKEIVNERDKTYSPLALYFLIDNKLDTNKEETNKLFDILIEKTKLEKEIKNLVIYKKALFNSDEANENDLIMILNPIFNSESVWKSHALYLMAEYFYYKNEKMKAKEFFEKILTTETGNRDIKVEAQKRLNRDFSE
tara:strand:- start:1300 stop:1947 length:648 start_codon:yes stop_codon:yes gene_type:complete